MVKLITTEARRSQRVAEPVACGGSPRCSLLLAGCNLAWGTFRSRSASTPRCSVWRDTELRGLGEILRKSYWLLIPFNK